VDVLVKISLITPLLPDPAALITLATRALVQAKVAPAVEEAAL
jgi:hypothetical protein